ncbi:diguanylate cyclase DosC [Peptococcaceae bacterium CEB3]|nr:diguanylate cyclase DosC [Peptococcaceae bacterium CEB3]
MKDIPAEVVERILEEVQVGLTLLDREGNLVWSNAVARRLFGWQGEGPGNILACHKPEAKEAVGKKLVDAGQAKEWHRIMRIDNRFIENVYSFVVIPEKFSGVMMFSRDVSERENMINDVWEKASHDPLTKLFNRQEFDRVYQNIVHSSKHGSKPFGLIMVDVNELKFVNDTYGHPAGDQLLIQTGRILQACVREQDSVFRLGGDEFVLIVASDKDSTLQAICSRIRRQCESSREELGMKVSLSVGTCLSSEVTRAEEVLSVADKRMYEDKAKYYLAKKGQRQSNSQLPPLNA